MRTRFLNNDFFFSAQTLTETLKTFNLLPLPAPHSPPNPPLQLDFPISDLETPICFEIDQFPFNGALSDFLSGVIPQFLEDDAVIDSAERPGKCLDLRSDESMKEIQFEPVEVDFPLRECISSHEKEEAGVSFEVPCIQIPLDNVDIEMEVTITYPSTVAKSICLVEDIPDCSSVKDHSSSPDNISKHTFKVPQFEVGKIGLGFERSMSMEEAFSGMLPTLELKPGAHGDELVIDAKEFIASTKIDILEDFSNYAASEECTKDKSVPFNSVLEMNIINLNGNKLLEEGSGMYPITLTGNCSPMLQALHFQEVQILDIPSVQIFEVLSSSEEQKLDGSDHMFKNDMDSVGSFYESVVSSELALVDDTFKSLPVPVLCDGKDMKSQAQMLGDILCILKPHMMTACDGLYLDWHPLLEGTCNRQICTTYMCIVQEISSYSLASELGVNDDIDEDTIHIDTSFLDDSLERSNMLKCKDMFTEIQVEIPCATSTKHVQAQIPKNDTNMAVNESHILKRNTEKASSLFASMSQSNDLNFFLDVCRGTSRSSNEEEIMNRCRAKDIPSGGLVEEPSEQSDLPKAEFVKWDIKVHQVCLSDPILDLIDHIQKSYLAILKYGTDLRSTALFATTDDLEFLSLPKQKLLKLINDKRESQFSSGCKDQTFVGLLTLYAIKQLTYLLCFYSIHTAHLYISNLTRNTDILVLRLRPLESLLEDARQKAEKQLIESHPSLSLIESILRSSGHQNGKILIVAERFLWIPLSQKLTCMNIKFHEVRQSYKISDQVDTLENSAFTNYILEALEHSDCLLISHENVSASFPFNIFRIIFEYGGASVSSIFTSLSPSLPSHLQVHFLKVSMENHSLAKKFCGDFDVEQHLNTEGITQSKLSLHGSLDNKNVVDLVKFVPTEKTVCFSSESENHAVASKYEDSLSIPQSLNSKNTGSGRPSPPDVVIVVNTQNFEKKMLISRRSSYQKVLALERGGVQVVERDINLPVDLIFSAAVCLVWYESRNLGDNTAATSIPIFMEMIATNVLMSLSFAFSGCILIFEGESNSLSAIMESSDALYAAAASLDLKLQLFCSYMPESTDEIILNCIENVTRLNRGIYPAMPESETLGESFLTKFPSINPLSAQAILASGGTLMEFLEWSQERRIQAFGKYHIPDESINLFNILCRFGEVGESKSVMTECSSIDSDISSGKLQCDRKRKKIGTSAHNLGMPMDDTFYFENFNKTYRTVELPQSSHPCKSRSHFNIQDMKTGYDGTFMNDDSFANESDLSTSMVSNLDTCGTVRYHKENLSNTVAYNSNSFQDENYSSIPSPGCFLGKLEPRSEPTVRSSLPDSRRLFNISGYRSFPDSPAINWDRDNTALVKQRSQSLVSKTVGPKSAYFDKDESPMKHQREYSNRIYNPKCTTHVLGLPSQAKESPLYGERPYSKINQFRRLNQGPLKTTDFLQRSSGKKEATHQQKLECNTCLSCPRSSKRSPSIIDSFRYQGGSQISDIVKKKKWRNKSEVQMNVRKEAKTDSSLTIPTTWTPIDKRARQYLSFARTGNEKQSKLVWRNRCSPSSNSTLRKRYRDEV